LTSTALRALPILFCLVLGSLPARAAEGDLQDAKRSEARDRFSRGLHLFENGDNGGALAEFKRAYELVPNRLALYNIALVYVALDKPVEAALTMERVLVDSGPLKPDYIARAHAVRDEQTLRIGLLDVKANVAAAIEIDGIKIGDAPLAAPLRVAAGTRVVGVLASGFLPIRKEIAIAGGAKAELTFELQPSETHLAHVEVRCPLPGSDILVDGTLVGKTPLPASVTVNPGVRVFELRRVGYLSAHKEIALSDGARGEVTFDPEEDARAESGVRGRLGLLLVEEGEVFLTIDGRARGEYRQPIELPVGSHDVKLERAGFEPLQRTIQVSSQSEMLVRADLRPTPETQSVYVAHARAYRTWAYAALITGAVIGGSGAGLALWGNSKLSSAQDTLTGVQNDFTNRRKCDATTGPSLAVLNQCNSDLANAQSDVTKYRNLRTGGIVGASVGVAAITVGVILLVRSPDPGHYDRFNPKSFASTLMPVFSGGPDGASLGLLGRF